MAEGGYPYNVHQWPGYPTDQPGYAVGYGHGGMVWAAYGAVPGYHQPGASPWPPQQLHQQHYVQQAHAAYYQQQQQQAMMSQHMQQQQYARQHPQYAPQQGVLYRHPGPPPVPPPIPPPPPAGRRSSSQGGSQAGVGTTPAPPGHVGGGQQNQAGGNSAGAGQPARQPYAPPIDTTAAGAGQTGTSSAASTPGANSGSILLAALQNNNTSHREHAAAASSAAAEPGGRSSYSSTAAAQQGAGSGRAAGPSSGDGSAGASSSSSARPGGRVDPRGVYLQGVPTDVTKEQLQELFSEQYGRVANVQIIGVKGHVTKCAFVNFADQASAQKMLAAKVTNMNNTAVHVLPKIVKTKTAAGEASSSNQTAGQQGASSSSSAAGTSKQAPQQQQQQQQQSKSLGVNEDGLPMVRGAVCCPFYMGIAQCSFKSACKYHHPRHAMHPECLLQGKKPQRYDYIIPPSYARLVNFTERLWDYDSCAEAQLKIWLARHLLASECSGCGMFDESAAVPAADEDAAYPDESQPLGPYSCTMDEADQVLQLLWKAQPDEAAKQAFPYKGKLRLLLADDPYYEIAPDPLSPGRMWVKLLLSPIKGLLNY